MEGKQARIFPALHPVQYRDVCGFHVFQLLQSDGFSQTALAGGECGEGAAEFYRDADSGKFYSDSRYSGGLYSVPEAGKIRDEDFIRDAGRYRGMRVRAFARASRHQSGQFFTFQ